MAVKLTPARRRGLAVLAARLADGMNARPEQQRCFRSNVTGDRGNGLVYWQTVDWLVGQGYAAVYGLGFCRLTKAGVELARAEGLLWSPLPLPRAACPACGGDVALRVGGELREHRDQRAAARAREGAVGSVPLCSASGMRVCCECGELLAGSEPMLLLGGRPIHGACSRSLLAGTR